MESAPWLVLWNVKGYISKATLASKKIILRVWLARREFDAVVSHAERAFVQLEDKSRKS